MAELFEGIAHLLEGLLNIYENIFGIKKTNKLEYQRNIENTTFLILILISMFSFIAVYHFTTVKNILGFMVTALVTTFIGTLIISRLLSIVFIKLFEYKIKKENGISR